MSTTDNAICAARLAVKAAKDARAADEAKRAATLVYQAIADASSAEDHDADARVSRLLQHPLLDAHAKARITADVSTYAAQQALANL